MRRLCLGGSFNPIHHAHLICARSVAEAGGFEQVVLIPSAQPPHKPPGPEMASSQHRLEMCRRAVGEDPLFQVDEIELNRSGPSYTIDTVRELRRRGWSEVHWLIGADMLRLLPSWHEPEALLAETHFAIMGRPGWPIDWSALPHAYKSLRERIYATPMLGISATDIRQRVAARQSIAYLTPPAVVRYIEEHRLYRAEAGA